MNLDDVKTEAPVKPLASPPTRQASQAVAGLMPPQLGEALIRDVRAGCKAASNGLANLGKLCVTLPSTVAGKLPSAPVVTALLWPIVWTALALPLLPLSWLLLLPGFAMRLTPFLCKRYTVTNRRVMIQRGLKPRPVQEIALADIDDVRFEDGSLDEFFATANLDLVSKGKVALKLIAVPDPESFRRTIVNAAQAWAPHKAV